MTIKELKEHISHIPDDTEISEVFGHVSLKELSLLNLKHVARLYEEEHGKGSFMKDFIKNEEEKR